jgi:hypothetical protein
MKMIKTILYINTLFLTPCLCQISTNFIEVPCTVIGQENNAAAFGIGSDNCFVSPGGNTVVTLGEDDFFIIETDGYRASGRPVEGERQLYAVNLSNNKAFWLEPITSEETANYIKGHYEFMRDPNYTVDTVNKVVVYKTVGGHLLKGVLLESSEKRDYMTFDEGTIYGAPVYHSETASIIVNVVHYGPEETSALGGMTSVVYRIKLNRDGLIQSKEILLARPAFKDSDGRTVLDIAASVDRTGQKTALARGVFDSDLNLQYVRSILFSDDYGSMLYEVADDVDFGFIPRIQWDGSSRLLYYTTGAKIARTGVMSRDTQFWTVSPAAVRRLLKPRKIASRLPAAGTASVITEITYNNESETMLYVENSDMSRLKLLRSTGSAVLSTSPEISSVGFSGGGISFTSLTDNKTAAVYMPLEQ